MKEKIIDRGHYVEVPAPEGVVVVPAGRRLAVCDALSGRCAYALEAGASLDLCLLAFPGESEGVELTVDLLGEGAEASLSGIYVCREGDFPLKVTVRHKVGGCTSNQLFNGIVAGSARTAFDGRIVVAPDAQKTKAFQTNHNLLLGADARAETRPQLEIYADDVECSHGATIGRLDEAGQFYMQSRGIPEKEARVLQMISFLSPVLEHVPEERREEIAARIEQTVRSL